MCFLIGIHVEFNSFFRDGLFLWRILLLILPFGTIETGLALCCSQFTSSLERPPYFLVFKKNVEEIADSVWMYRNDAGYIFITYEKKV